MVCWALLLGDSQFSEPVYYAIGIGKSLLIGGFFTIFSIGLGWLTFQMFYSHYIQEGVLAGLLFAVSVVPGPVTLFKGIREIIGRVKKYWNEK